MKRNTLFFIFLLLTITYSHSAPITKRRKLDFKKLHTNQLYFPPFFLFGFAIAEQQNSGCDNLPNSNWSRWEETSWKNGTPHIKNNQRSGVANDHWNLYQTDIDLMKKDFNANAFRFSIAWDRIEPEEGVFDEEAVQHYSDEVDALLKAGIVPMITLHHFAHPNWFEDKGAFEKEENIHYFTRFAKKMFAVLGDRVPFWCTINEPTIYMFQGYLPFNCAFPPGKGSLTSWPLAVKVLRNMMQAHTEVYQALKKMPHGVTAQIGLAHAYLKFHPWSFFNILECIPGMILNRLMVDTVIDFLKTGTFSYGVPFYYHETYTAPISAEKDAAPQLSDFVGLNYYSRVLIEFKFTRMTMNSSPDVYETMTDMPYAIYPNGMYHALHHVAETGLPLYITENGIADRSNTDDSRRVQWITQYLKAVSLALEDGLDIRGYFYWTLTDNFEWDCGWDTPFGLYAVDRTTQKRTLKDGGKVYASIIKQARAGMLQCKTDDCPPRSIKKLFDEIAQKI